MVFDYIFKRIMSELLGFCNAKAEKVGVLPLEIDTVARCMGDVPVPIYMPLMVDQVKREFTTKKLSIGDAKKRIFPLIVLRAGTRGITKLSGNESYIRQLYRQRWFIEIAFREMNRLGISSHLRGRDSRLGILGAKALCYNMWQVQRLLAAKADPIAEPLELNEFLGKTISRRYYQYLSPVAATP